MATKYWTAGGSGNWSDSNNWSTTSGSGRTANTTAPSTTDAAVFDAISGSGTATLDISPTIQTLTMTGFTGTLAFGTNTITLNSTGTVFTGATTMAVTGTPLIILTTPTPTTSARTITPTAVTEANSISFRITSGTGALGLTAGSYRDLDFTDGTNPTGYGGSITNTSITIYGNFKASTSGMTRVAGTGTYTFAATSGTKTITPAGVVFDNIFAFNGVGGTWQLQGNLILGPTPAGVDSTRNLTLTSGTLDLNNFTATAGQLSSTGSVTRVLAFGASGKIVVTGFNTNVAVTTTATGLTVTGSKRVELSYSGSVGTRTILGPSSGTTIEGTNLLDYFVTAGADTVTFNGARNFGTIDFSNSGTSTFTGSFTNQAINVYGNLTLKTGMTVGSGGNAIEFLSTIGTKTITTANQTLDCPIAFTGVGGAWQLQDALTLGSTRTITLTFGTLNLNGYTLSTGLFSSNNSNVRTLTSGGATITLTGSGTTIWNTGTSTNLTYTTIPTANANYSLSVGTRTINTSATSQFNLNVTAGTDIVTNVAGSSFNNLNFTGFAGTFSNVGRSIFGNLTLSTGMTLTSGTLVTQFVSTSTATITSNGKTIDFPITFDGIGGTFACQDALSVTSTLTITNGTLQLKSGTTNTVGTFVATSATIKSLQATTPGSQATISQASGTVNATNISIQDSNATGGAVWNASNTLGNVNLGNNTGWRFSIALSSVSGTGAVGTVISAITPTALTGVQATGAVGNLYPGWYLIPTTQTPAWTNIVQL